MLRRFWISLTAVLLAVHSVTALALPVGTLLVADRQGDGEVLAVAGDGGHNLSLRETPQDSLGRTHTLT